MPRCKERSGFLFAHGCDHQASDKCAKCGKAICLRHCRRTAAGTYCITCTKQQEQTGARAGEQRRHRDPYFYPYYYYPGYHSYDERDYRAFDRPETGEERAGLENDPDGS